MFGTLRYDSQGNSPNFVEMSSHRRLRDPQNTGDQYFACERCYSKKLGCNRAKGGCDRCLSTSSKCVYNTQRNKNNSTRRRNYTKENQLVEDRKLETADPRSPDIASSRSTMGLLALPQSESRAQAAIALAATPCSPEFPSFWEPNLPHEFTTDAMDNMFDQSMIFANSDAESPALGNDVSASALGSETQLPSVFDSCTTEGSDSSAGSVGCRRIQENWTKINHGEISHASRVATQRTSTQPHHQPQSRSNHDQQRRDTISFPMSYKSIEPPQTRGLNHARSISTSSCACLRIASSVLEELETNNSLLDSASIPSMMAVNQQTLSRCDKMLSCQECSGSSERMLLLALIFERLVTLFESAAAKCLQFAQDDNWRNQELGHMEVYGLQQSFFLGEYEVKHQGEMKCLTRILIVLQLKALSICLDKLKVIAARSDRAIELLMLRAGQRRAHDMLKKLHGAEYWGFLDNMKGLFHSD